MDKEAVVRIHNGMLFSHNVRENHEIYCILNRTGGYYVKISKREDYKYQMIPYIAQRHDTYLWYKQRKKQGNRQD